MSFVDDLERLGNLYATGGLSDLEFTSLKTATLDATDQFQLQQARLVIEAEQEAIRKQEEAEVRRKAKKLAKEQRNKAEQEAMEKLQAFCGYFLCFIIPAYLLFLYFQHTAENRSNPKQNSSLVPVLVAIKDIDAGTLIDNPMDMFESGNIDKEIVDKVGRDHDSHPIRSFTSIQDKILTRPLKSGDKVFTYHLKPISSSNK